MDSNWMNKPHTRRDALGSLLMAGGMTAGGGLLLSACAGSTSLQQAE